MKHKFLIVLWLLLSTTSLAQAVEPIVTGENNNKAIYGYDPVAYFTQNMAIKGDSAIVVEWRGAQWYFRDVEHKAMFVAMPTKYAPQYGGYCSLAMSEGRFESIDGEAFTIYDNQLYLFKNDMQAWHENKAQLIQLAEEFYTSQFDFSAESSAPESVSEPIDDTLNDGDTP